ncbi:MAG: hypothetical protein ABSB58_05595 [Gemmatimonadales bacterium]|jgi:hypothetical protein
MRFTRWEGLAWGAVAAVVVVAAGCSIDSTRQAANAAQTRIAISQGTVSSLASASLSLSEDSGGPPGFIDASKVDSLIVAVTSVDVLPESLLALRHAGEPWGPPGADSIVKRLGGGPVGPGGLSDPGFDGRLHFPFGPGGIRDSLHQRDSTALRDTLGWGKLPEDWYSLDVVGSGHLDLMNLPTDTVNGLQLAAGTVPAGNYRAAQLIVSSATIYFNTAIATDSGVTLQPHVGYAVTLPPGPKQAIPTMAGFSLPEGASVVVLVFDPHATLRGAVVTRRGEILINPGLGHGPPHR